jgi:hypothetical protein
LNWSYDYLYLKKQNLANVMPVILYLCSVHFLRIIIKKAKVQYLNNKNLLKRFLFAFTLLQNSTSFEQLEELFKDIFNMFYQGKKKTLFEESIIKISNQLCNRNFTFDFDLDPKKNTKS